MSCWTILTVIIRKLVWGDFALIKLFKKGNNNIQVGVEVRTDGIAFAKAVRNGSQSEWGLAFHEFVKDYFPDHEMKDIYKMTK